MLARKRFGPAECLPKCILNGCIGEAHSGICMAKSINSKRSELLVRFRNQSSLLKPSQCFGLSGSSSPLEGWIGCCLSCLFCALQPQKQAVLDLTTLSHCLSSLLGPWRGLEAADAIWHSCLERPLGLIPSWDPSEATHVLILIHNPHLLSHWS
jgi:hypothetical protein